MRNLQACKELGDTMRTSLGPNGMNKMIINHLDRLFVTSDCATMLREMEIQHPAAKLILMAAAMQEIEVGDGSNFVVCLAAELLAKAEDLVKMGLHPTEIVAGYVKAGKKAHEILDSLAVLKMEEKDLFVKANLVKGVRSAIAAKQFGCEDIIAPLVAEACLTVMPANPANFLVDNVRVVKILGGGLEQSEVIKGMVIPHDTIGAVKRVKDAKVVVYTGSIQATEMETKGTILLTNAKGLLDYGDAEEDEIEKIIKGIYEAGVRVVVTGGSVDDMAGHFLEKYGLLTIRVTSKFEIRRLCKAVKATPLVNVEPPKPEELGFCSDVYVREVGLRKVTVFSQDSIDDTAVATVLVRASTDSLLNDVERAVDDGVNVVRAMGRDARFVAGAGATEVEVAKQLAAYGAKFTGLEQYSVAKFAEALEIIPLTLAENAGQNGTDTLSQLFAAHHNEKQGANFGVDIADGGVKDALADNILDSLLAKKQGLTLALDAAVSVLRVDQIIVAKQAGGPKAPKNQGNWDE